MKLYVLDTNIFNHNYYKYILIFDIHFQKCIFNKTNNFHYEILIIYIVYTQHVIYILS